MAPEHGASPLPNTSQSALVRRHMERASFSESAASRRKTRSGLVASTDVRIKKHVTPAMMVQQTDHQRWLEGRMG